MSEQRIPIPVYRSRFTPLDVLLQTPGDGIDWKIGDPAWAVGTLNGPNGTKKPVIIRSERVGHADVPGVPCYECELPEEGGAMYCISAERLSIREGWKP